MRPMTARELKTAPGEVVRALQRGVTIVLTFAKPTVSSPLLVPLRNRCRPRRHRERRRKQHLAR
jgi:hypothetical protein